jgi:6-phosphogluconate dehydrogenase
MNVLVIDLGGSHVKVLASGEKEPRRFDSGPKLTPLAMVEGVRQLTSDWSYQGVSLGYPGPVMHGLIAAEPRNLGTGWLGFDFERAFGMTVKVINDAAMQALGSYQGGRMLFLGLGTGLGSAVIADGRLESTELAHLPYRKGRTYEDYVGSAGLARLGKRRWEKHVWATVELLKAALEVDYVVVGGGNAKKLGALPQGVRLGDNAHAFEGGFRLWNGERGTSDRASASGRRRRPVDMTLGMIGLGRMGANMTRRLMRAGLRCVVFDRAPAAVSALTEEGATAADTLKDLVTKLPQPRAIWLMVPTAVVDEALAELAPLLAAGDTIIDGGNSYYVDDIRRAKELALRGIHYVDVGTSGGVWGLERGYCQMIGGNADVVARLTPVFEALAPPMESATRTPGRENHASSAEHGFLHCGDAGAGHFVKMVHNGIEYGLMASYAEGLNVLRHAGIGRTERDKDAETAPLREPEHYRYELDLAAIAEVWRRGSVIASWLLDLTAQALLEEPGLESFAGRVSDSGEGRWTVKAAIDESVPVPVLSTALYERFSSRGEADFGDRLLSAMRQAFGGHTEKA